MTTFSQLIDSIIVETKRPDMVASMAMYVNQSIRKVHTQPSIGSIVLFDENRFEEQVTVLDSPHMWPISMPQRFQRLEAAYSLGRGAYVPLKSPSVTQKQKGLIDADLFYYRTGPAIAFSGLPIGSTLNLSYHLYPRRLAYETPDARTVIYDPVDDDYKTPLGLVPTEDQLELTTNWVLTRWAGVIEQGLRSAMFRGIGDFDRSRLAYSAFEDDRLQLWQSEPNSAVPA